MSEAESSERKEWVCPNEHIQMWPAVIGVEGGRPWCVVCFTEWAAGKFPTKERPRP